MVWVLPVPGWAVEQQAPLDVMTRSEQIVAGLADAEGVGFDGLEASGRQYQIVTADPGRRREREPVVAVLTVHERQDAPAHHVVDLHQRTDAGEEPLGGFGGGCCDLQAQAGPVVLLSHVDHRRDRRRCEVGEHQGGSHAAEGLTRARLDCVVLDPGQQWRPMPQGPGNETGQRHAVVLEVAPEPEDLVAAGLAS